MSKLLKNPNGTFMKGVCTNPNGRKKGLTSEATKNFLKIRTMAAEKYPEAFKILWEAVQAKEPWAHQLFFKELAPKRLRHESVMLDVSDKTREGQLKSLSEALTAFDQVTQDEIIERLRALAAVKLSEQVDNEEVTMRANRVALIAKIEKLVELKTAEGEEADNA